VPGNAISYRNLGSKVKDCLPIFKCEGVGAINWDW
jgi:hypothetical protein